MEKRIDKKKVSLQLALFRAGLSIGVVKLFNDLPEDTDGPVVTLGALQDAAEDLFDNQVMPKIKELISGLPEVTDEEIQLAISEEEQPQSDVDKQVVRIMRGPDIWINPALRPRFIGDKLGPEYGKRFRITFSDGRVMDVPNSSRDVNTVAGRGYRPGGHPDTHPDVEFREVYADPDTSPAYIDIEILA